MAIMRDENNYFFLRDFEDMAHLPICEREDFDNN